MHFSKMCKNTTHPPFAKDCTRIFTAKFPFHTLIFHFPSLGIYDKHQKVVFPYLTVFILPSQESAETFLCTYAIFLIHPKTNICFPPTIYTGFN